MTHERRYSIAIPKFSNRDSRGARVRVPAETLHRYAAEISKHFGGVTVTPSQIGCWYNHWVDPPEHECEEVMSLVTAREMDGKENWPINPQTGKKAKNASQVRNIDREFLQQFSKQLGTELGQWTVMETETQTDVQFHTPIKRKGFKSLQIPEPIEREAELFSRLLD
ncbi:MAG: hypothetical protein QGG54_01130 [Gammaproteobacteria bacterium]|jgi:hypothetical protein|nr:hypothetical protein [Gammaproteobacteria bacterium]|tara:strand:+ start:196 stop:696 length:501 start_codon:yes stop_codon:yes gene_type:complete